MIQLLTYEGCTQKEKAPYAQQHVPLTHEHTTADSVNFFPCILPFHQVKQGATTNGQQSVLALEHLSGSTSSPGIQTHNHPIAGATH